jgi:hypothetical protein
VSKRTLDDIKTRILNRSGKNLLATCLPSRWYPAFRQREFNPGSFMELREPVIFMLRENSKNILVSRKRVPMEYTGADRFVVAKKFL